MITIGLAAISAVAIAPAAAWAAPSPLQDDLSAGAPDANAWLVEPGVLRLKPAVSANFDGTALPTGWTATPWDVPPTGTATVANGAVTVNAARVNTDAFQAGAGGVLEFRATFSSGGNQHVGFGDDFNQGPWAMFSTRGGNEGLFARTRTDGAAASTDTAITTAAIPGFDPLQPHVYRIEWTAQDVKFYVDGTLVVTPAAVIPGDMRPVISDFPPAAEAVAVDWIARSPYPASGTFESRVFEADDTRAVWSSITAATAVGVSFETRSGNNPGTMSAYQAVGPGGAIQSPPGKYIQYRATLDGATPGASLDDVSITYAIDTTAPATSIGSADVSGTTAKVTFSSPDADVAGFECSLNGGAFSTCTSPKEFGGLSAGSHTIAVRAVDKATNVGAAASRTVTVAGSGGGPGGPGGGGDDTDTEAPAVTIGSRTRNVSASGKFKLRLSCPADEESCAIKVRIKLRGKTVATNSITLDGGEAGKVALRLNSKARRKLARRGQLKPKAVLTAVDAAGNSHKSKYKVTLR